MKVIDIVIPIFNEGGAIERNLPVIVGSVCAIEGFDFRFIVVDDGSTDNSATWVRSYCLTHRGIELICLTRNFGKEAAILAGLERVRGEAAIVMDSDLQHPPNLVPRMLTLWQGGVDVVEACKSSRGKESVASRILARGFYRAFNALAGMDIEGHSDFKLLDRKVIDAYCALPERKRFFRALIVWMGFDSARLYFDVPQREHGTSVWSRFQLLRFSLSAITGFSSVPLHLITLLGFLSFVLALVVGGLALYDKISGRAVDGFTTVILLILLSGGFVMIGLGLLGVYVERIFDEIKKRPIYLVDPRKGQEEVR